MARLILVLNAGSSSLKFSAFTVAPRLQLLLRGQIEGLHTAGRFVAKNADGVELGSRQWAPTTVFGHEEALAFLADWLRAFGDGHELVGVGHRVVHGGMAYREPVRVDAEVVDALGRLSPLAPLHQPHNLKPISILLASRPGLPQVACFDTAFHRGQSEVAQSFALPPEITERGVRRYGFHGLSYEHIARVLPEHDPRAATGRTVVAHLGNGSSLCAMDAGRSVASTMGFTAVDGLPMGTRCGSLDPGVVLYLMDELQMDTRAIERLLYRESGLLGVSGVSSDMRTLLDSEDPRARFAVDLYVHRIGREIGSLAAALQGLDALVFTAGIGEHAAWIRERVCREAAWLGVELDPAANRAGGPNIGTPGSRVAVWVLPTDEEGMIARHTLAVLQNAPGGLT
jgi:acetate kinase